MSMFGDPFFWLVMGLGGLCSLGLWLWTRSVKRKTGVNINDFSRISRLQRQLAEQFPAEPAPEYAIPAPPTVATDSVDDLPTHPLSSQIRSKLMGLWLKPDNPKDYFYFSMSWHYFRNAEKHENGPWKIVQEIPGRGLRAGDYLVFGDDLSFFVRIDRLKPAEIFLTEYVENGYSETHYQRFEGADPKAELQKYILNE